MRAAVLDQPAAPVRVREIATPRPRRGEILVRVHAAGVNPADWKVARGHTHPELRRRFPLTPGFDMSGVVEAIGPGVSRYHIGDEIFGVIWPEVLQHGTYAEYVVAADGMALTRKPASLPFDAAAALPTPGLTALKCMRAAAIESGDVTLVVGASGGVGSYVVQLASRAGGTVVATARPEAESLVRELGAAEVVDHTSSSLTKHLAQRFPAGIQVVIDLVTPDSEIQQVAALLQPGGRLVSTRYAANPVLLAARGISAHNIDLRASTEDLNTLSGLAINNVIRAKIGHIFSLYQASAALMRSEHGPVRGRIVLLIN